MNSYTKALFDKFTRAYKKYRTISTMEKDGDSLNLFNAVLYRLKRSTGSYKVDDRPLLGSLLKEALCYEQSAGIERYRYYLTVYELYKKIINIPGHIVEIGVWRGYTTALLSYLVQLFGEVDRHRHIYGFDTFEGYPGKDMLMESDSSNPVLMKNYENTSLEYVNSLVSNLGASSFVHFIKGDISETLPAFLDSHKDFKVALVMNDCNLYAPTKAALSLLIPRMQPGGIIYFDSYNNPRQLGETRAADEILSQYGLVLQKDLPPITQPAYCVIPKPKP